MAEKKESKIVVDTRITFHDPTGVGKHCTVVELIELLTTTSRWDGEVDVKILNGLPKPDVTPTGVWKHSIQEIVDEVNIAEAKIIQPRVVNQTSKVIEKTNRIVTAAVELARKTNWVNCRECAYPRDAQIFQEELDKQRRINEHLEDDILDLNNRLKEGLIVIDQLRTINIAAENVVQELVLKKKQLKNKIRGTEEMLRRPTPSPDRLEIIDKAECDVMNYSDEGFVTWIIEALYKAIDQHATGLARMGLPICNDLRKEAKRRFKIRVMDEKQ